MPPVYLLVSLERSDPESIAHAAAQLPQKIRELLDRPPCLCDAPEDPDVIRDDNGTKYGFIRLFIPR